MNESVQRFEAMGVDLDMLSERHEDIAAKQAEVQEMTASWMPGAAPSAEIDERDLLRRDINARLQVSRDRLYQGLMGPAFYDKVIRGGEKVVGWLFGNQVLQHGVNIIEAEYAGLMVDQFGSSWTRTLMIARNHSAVIIPSVQPIDATLKVGHDNSADTIDFGRGYHHVEREAARRTKDYVWHTRPGLRPFTVGYGDTMFSPETADGDEGLGIKFLTNSSDIRGYLRHKKEFERFPELAVELQGLQSGGFSRSEYLQYIDNTNAKFEERVAQIAAQATKPVVQLKWDGDRLDDELLLKAAITQPDNSDASLNVGLLRAAVIDEICKTDFKAKQTAVAAAADMHPIRRRYNLFSMSHVIDGIADRLIESFPIDGEARGETKDLFEDTLYASIGALAYARMHQGTLTPRQCGRVEKFVTSKRKFD